MNYSQQFHQLKRLNSPNNCTAYEKKWLKSFHLAVSIWGSIAWHQELLKLTINLGMSSKFLDTFWTEQSCCSEKYGTIVGWDGMWWWHLPDTVFVLPNVSDLMVRKIQPVFGSAVNSMDHNQNFTLFLFNGSVKVLVVNLITAFIGVGATKLFGFPTE